MNGVIETQTLAQNQSKRILLVLFSWYLLDEKQMLKPQKQFHFWSSLLRDHQNNQTIKVVGSSF